MWKWATVIGLSMTPALVLGQSAACVAGIGFGFDPAVLIAVVAAAGFVEGLIIVWLARLAGRIPRLERWLGRFHTPRAVAWMNRWGPLGGLMLVPAAVGQEPAIVTLVWMDVPARRLILPLALSNVVYTLIYYAIVRYGWDAL